MATTSTERCYYLDLAKVITAFLVIFGHLYSEDSLVRLHLYAFHLPLFLIISGVFHKYSGKIDLKRYAQRILWPTAIFLVLQLVANVLIHGQSLGTELRNIFVDIPRGAIHGPIWFLFALFWCKVFLDIYLKFKNKVFPILIWAGLLFIPIYILKGFLPLGMSQGMMSFPFYLAGFYCRDYLKSRPQSFKWAPVFVACLILTVLITKLQGRVSILQLRFGGLGITSLGSDYVKSSFIYKGFVQGANIVLYYLNGFIGSVMILSLALLPFPKVNFVTALSKSLITVVGTQSLFTTIYRFNVGYDKSLLLSAGVSICIFLLCYLLHQILQPVYNLVRRK